MCGIAGSIGPIKPDQERVDATLFAMQNRGPDSSGVYYNKIGKNIVSLLHSRLSIIDLDPRSHQPFIDDKYILVYNGEIYNYIELKLELESLGHRFTTTSDTEVVVKSYKQFGASCVDHFEGMWAFALLDKRENKVFFSRDRFGEKPLYYSLWNGTLYFGSEIKFLSELSGIKPSINYDQISRYLVNGYKSLYKKPSTFYSDIMELPPASYAFIDSPKKLDPKQYFKISFSPSEMKLSDVVEGAREHIVRSLSSRLRSDVPLAFCLSGGVDSTALASVASKKLGHELHAFTIIDSDERYNETKNVLNTVNHLECHHHIARTSRIGFFERLKKLIAYHDSPVSTISYYVHSFLSEEISSRGFKVAISGTGADELFTGYYDHYGYWIAEMYQEKNNSSVIEDWRNSYGKFVQNPYLQDPLVFYNNPNERRHIFMDRDYFNSFQNVPFNEDFSEVNYSSNLLRNRMLNELNNEVIPVILHEDDLNSMMWSVENRSPYLDSNLVKFLYSVPNKFLIQNGFSKWILREATKEWTPKTVIWDKQKRGFNASITSLIDISDSKTKENLLSDGPIFDLINRKVFEKFLLENMESNNFSKFLFSFISAKIFLEISSNN